MGCAAKPLALRVNSALRKRISSLRLVRTWVQILGPRSAGYKRPCKCGAFYYLLEGWTAPHCGWPFGCISRCEIASARCARFEPGFKSLVPSPPDIKDPANVGLSITCGRDGLRRVAAGPSGEFRAAKLHQLAALGSNLGSNPWPPLRQI